MRVSHNIKHWMEKILAGTIRALSPRFAAVLCLALLSGEAWADGSGSLTSNAGTIRFPFAYAFVRADEHIANASVTTVIFSTRAIDAAKADKALDRISELRAQTRGANWVELNIRPEDGSIEYVDWLINGKGDTVWGKHATWFKIAVTRNDDQRIEGTFRSTDEKDRKSARGYFDLRFALDLPRAPNLGAALQADGGEPFAAYEAYSEAMSKGDFDTAPKFMLKKVSSEFRSGFLTRRNDPSYKSLFEMLQKASMHDPIFDKGNINGNEATLFVHGKDGVGAASESTVSMRREDGAWRFASESLQTR